MNGQNFNKAAGWLAFHAGLVPGVRIDPRPQGQPAAPYVQTTTQPPPTLLTPPQTALARMERARAGAGS